MIRLLTYLRPYWRQVLLGVILVLVEAMSNLYLPNLNAAIVNNGIARGDLGYIIRTGVFMLLVTFLLGACAVLANVIVTWVGSRRVDMGAMPIGNLTAFLTYIMHILFSVMISVMMFSMIPRASASREG